MRKAKKEIEIRQKQTNAKRLWLIKIQRTLKKKNKKTRNNTSFT